MDYTFFHLGLGDVPEVCANIDACVHGYKAERHARTEVELFNIYLFDFDELPESFQKSRMNSFRY